MKTTPNPFLLTLTVSAALLAQAKPASNQPEDHQRRVSEWDHATAERLLRKGAWREGVAYLGRALRLDPKNSAAARQLWSAVVYGEGDRNTVPTLVLPQEAKVHVALFSPDGRRILTASSDKTARLWDTATGAPIGEPMRHEDEVVDAAFSPDGARDCHGQQGWHRALMGRGDAEACRQADAARTSGRRRRIPSARRCPLQLHRHAARDGLR